MYGLQELKMVTFLLMLSIYLKEWYMENFKNVKLCAYTIDSLLELIEEYLEEYCKS